VRVDRRRASVLDGAIFHEDDVPDEWRDYVALNAEMANVCPPILEQKEPFSDCRSQR
jgi:hypothetical protein